MAIFYSRLSTLSRSRGQSAVAAAAYRCGGKLKDERLGKVHDYRRKGGVLDARTLAPADASWALDAATLWNRAEMVEVRCNARTARELIVALPAELPQAAQIELAQAIGQDLVDHYRVAVLVAVHAPDKAGDDRNTHVHLLMTTREVGADGFGPKTRVLDDKSTGPPEAERMRERVAARINAALERAGIASTVDPRPLSVQAEEAAERGDLDAVVRLTRTPTRHQGRAATAAARKDRFSPVVHDNETVQRDNRSVARRGRARAARLRAESHSLAHAFGKRPAPPRPAPSAVGRRRAARLNAAAAGPVLSGNSTERYMQALQADARRLELSMAELAAVLRTNAADYRRVADLWRQTRWAHDRSTRLAFEVGSGRSRPIEAADPERIRPSAVPKPSATAIPPPTSLSRRQWADYRRSLRRLDGDLRGAPDVFVDDSERRSESTAEDPNLDLVQWPSLGSGRPNSHPAARLRPPPAPSPKRRSRPRVR